jgi:hypothetical protein
MKRKTRQTSPTFLQSPSLMTTHLTVVPIPTISLMHTIALPIKPSSREFVDFALCTAT